MIGKMYRPLKILNIPGKRGFSILNRYKSNFGSTFKFEADIYLNYNAEDKTEVVQLECRDLQIPIYIEQGHRLSEDKVVSSTTPRTIESLRKLIRPTKISSQEVLEFIMMIESSKDETENDMLEVRFVPIIMGNEEYMKIEVISKTPIVVSSQTPLTLAE